MKTVRNRRVAALPGYSFADVLKYSTATRSNLIHWTNTHVIEADIEDTSGPGHPRRFSLLNVLEAELAASMNRLKVPLSLIGEAVSKLRSVHEGAIAVRASAQAGRSTLTDAEIDAMAAAWGRHSVRRDRLRGSQAKSASAYARSLRTMFALPEGQAGTVNTARAWLRFCSEPATRRRQLFFVLVSFTEKSEPNATVMYEDGKTSLGPDFLHDSASIIVNLAVIFNFVEGITGAKL